MRGSHGAPSAPRRVLSTLDGVVLVVGLVVGAGIFRSPPIVASNAGDVLGFLLLWVGGGVVAIVGALCYAELASTYPHPGGEYHVLRRAFGHPMAFLLGWSRLTVLQTGSIALLSFVFTDYAAGLFLRDGAAVSPLLGAAVAGAVVVVLTLVNSIGLRPGRNAQYVLTVAVIVGLLAVIVAGFVVAASGEPPATAATTSSESASGASLALAMVFVLLTFGGWSEAAYLSAEMRDARRGVLRTLAWGVAVVTALYLLANASFVAALGLGGVGTSAAVAIDVMRAATGQWGAIIVGLIVMAAALSSANATMITGARGSFAVGSETTPLAGLGVWTSERDGSGTPRRAVIAQGIISLILVGFGAATRAGFETMVAYTAPVFWLTLLLMGIALLVLRRRDPDRERPFAVPLYPATPLFFCATSLAMLYSSIAYAGKGALLGVIVMLVGVPVLLIGREKARRADAIGSLNTST